MPRTIPRVAGLISVVIVGGLLGFLVFGVVQGGSDPPEAERPSGPRIGPTPGPDDLREVGADFEVTIGPKLDEAIITCIDGSPHLSLQTSDETLPAGAVITVRPVSEVPTASEITGRFSAVGPAQRIEVASATSTVEADLLSSIATEDSEKLAVVVEYKDAAGGRRQRSTLLDANLARC